MHSSAASLTAARTLVSRALFSSLFDALKKSLTAKSTLLSFIPSAIVGGIALGVLIIKRICDIRPVVGVNRRRRLGTESSIGN
jgi:hypothetical protein